MFIKINKIVVHFIEILYNFRGKSMLNFFKLYRDFEMTFILFKHLVFNKFQTEFFMKFYLTWKRLAIASFLLFSSSSVRGGSSASNTSTTAQTYLIPPLKHSLTYPLFPIVSFSFHLKDVK